jgi:hypothetical protein
VSPSSSLSAVLGQLADLAREDALVESDPVGRAGPSSSLVTRLSLSGARTRPWRLISGFRPRVRTG